MLLIFLGPPGSGKGTQAKKLTEKLGLTHLSTGDLLRRAMEQKSALGENARKYVEGGQLVPDDVMLAMIKEELTRKWKGFILDGFPRTVAQARGLDRILKELGTEIDKVISLKVDDAAIIERLMARRLCRSCGFEYNLKTRPPRLDNTCDRCGGELYRRDDDTPEVIQNRLSVYRQQTRPIEELYKNRRILVEIDGNKGFDEVFGSITEKVGVGK